MNLRDPKENPLHPIHDYQHRTKGMIGLMQEGMRRECYSQLGVPYEPAGPHAQTVLADRLFLDPTLSLFMHGIAFASILMADTLLVLLREPKKND